MEYQRWRMEEGRHYLHSIVMLPDWEKQFGVQCFHHPESYRLVNKLNGDEDVSFWLQGVLVTKDLPPMLYNPKVPKTKYPMLQQTVELTRLGVLAMEMFGSFHRAVPESKLLAWEGTSCSLSSGRTISFLNRYFTHTSECKGLRPIPFSPEVDPRGILGCALSSSLIHTSDNEVEYLELISKSRQEPKYALKHPSTFRPGDIVEVEFSLVAYKSRDDSYMIKPMLYSLVLLDGKVADQMAILKASVAKYHGGIGKSVKRKSGYVLEEEASQENDVQGRKRLRLTLGDVAASVNSPSQLALDGMSLET
ncbi:hypothetical protein AX16_007401 [Volvariella volvacea WC 439]|nr:hypothetical protein AX16_007401 [Volvariella volvacea WC 439]